MFNITLIFSFCLILSVDSWPSIRFSPTSKEVHVLMLEDFQFGFEHRSDVVKCYYETNTGLSKSFDVIHTHNAAVSVPEITTNNYIYEHGKNGRCMLTVRNVDPRCPTLWNITAGSTITGNYTTQQMVVRVTGSIEFFPHLASIHIIEGGTYTVGYKYCPSIAKCILTIDGITIDVNIQNASSIPSKEELQPSYKTAFNRVTSKAIDGLCQFDIRNYVKQTDSLNITAIDHKGKLITSTIPVKIHYFNRAELTIFPRSGTVFVKPGQIYYIGFEEHGGITECYGESSQGHNVYVKLKHTEFFNYEWDTHDTDDGLEIHSNIFSARRCEISVVHRNNGPHYWRITVSNGMYNITTKRFNVIDLIKDGPTPTPETRIVNVLEGGEYMIGYQYSNFIRKCHINGNGTTYLLKMSLYEVLNAQKEKISKEVDNNDVVWSYASSGMCMIHIVNVTLARGARYWHFNLYTNDNILIPGEISYIVNIYPKDSIKPTHKVQAIYIQGNNEYKIGFEKHPAISECFIETNVGGYYSFPVVYKSSILHETVNLRFFEDVCQVDVGYNHIHTPTSYTITASNGFSNISSKSFIVYPYERKTSKRVQAVIPIAANQSFVQFIEFLDQPFTKCTLSSKNIAQTYDVTSKCVENEEGINDFEILPINSAQCGFQVINMRRTDILNNRVWNIIVTDEFGHFYGDEFCLQLVERDISPQVEVPVILGQSVNITCQYFSNKGFCELYNSKNELIQTQASCSYNIPVVAVDHLGKWKCIHSELGSFNTLEYTVELIEKDLLVVTTAVKEENDFFIIECKSQIEFDSCIMISPTKENYVIEPWLATKRYSCATANFTKGICSMEIWKPLQQFEKGIWACELQKDGKLIGNKIHVNSTAVPEYQRKFKQTFSDLEDFVINCEIPKYSSNCYITSPSGQAFLDQNTFKPYSGRCALHVSKDYAAKNGTWKCSFSETDDIHDETIEVEVEIAQATPKFSTVQAKKGSPLKISYLSGRSSLLYCFYLSPQNKSYYLTSISKKYIGRGLEYGECGISFEHTTAEHYGLWTCITKIGWSSSHKPIVTKILVEDPDAIPATSQQDTNVGHSKLGTTLIAIGLIMTVVALGVIMFKKYVYKK